MVVGDGKTDAVGDGDAADDLFVLAPFAFAVRLLAFGSLDPHAAESPSTKQLKAITVNVRI